MYDNLHTNLMWKPCRPQEDSWGSEEYSPQEVWVVIGSHLTRSSLVETTWNDLSCLSKLSVLFSPSVPTSD